MKITKVGHFSGHKNSIYTIHPSIQPNCFYSGASDGFVVEWDLASKGDGVLLVNVQKPVYSLLTIPHKQELLIGTATGHLHIVDLNSRKEVRNLEAHKGGIFSLTLFEGRIYSTGEDGMVHIWDANTYVLITSIHASDKSARVLTTSHERNEFAIGFSDHKIRIYNTSTNQLMKVLDDHVNSVFALSYSNDGKYLLSGGRDAKLHIRDCNNQFEFVNDIPAHTLHINCICYSPDGKLIATASMDKTVKIWEAQTFELLKVIDKIKNQGHISSVNKVFWYNNTHVLSCSDDKQIMLWEVE